MIITVHLCGRSLSKPFQRKRDGIQGFQVGLHRQTLIYVQNVNMAMDLCIHYLVDLSLNVFHLLVQDVALLWTNIFIYFLNQAINI
jgi:hypothetical protein